MNPKEKLKSLILTENLLFLQMVETNNRLIKDIEYEKEADIPKYNDAKVKLLEGMRDTAENVCRASAEYSVYQMFIGVLGLEDLL